MSKRITLANLFIAMKTLTQGKSEARSGAGMRHSNPGRVRGSDPLGLKGSDTSL